MTVLAHYFMTHSLYWFTHDLRLNDNQLLKLACEQKTPLSFVYCVDPKWFKTTRFSSQTMGKYRWQFLVSALRDLDAQLKSYGQHLVVYHQPAYEVISHYYHHHNVRTLYCSEQIGFNERQSLSAIGNTFDNLKINQANTFTLYDEHQLPFSGNDLPATFSKFRKIIEHHEPQILAPINTPTYLPPPLIAPMPWPKTLPEIKKWAVSSQFIGGEQAAMEHLNHYFTGDAASNYKQTRNALDGVENSTKFSLWLANGNLSVRLIIAALHDYEQKHGANDSTYWIFFELLWREYFQLYSVCYGKKLFSFKGIGSKKPLTSFYSQRFKQWCLGTTPYPIVNACMKQLNQTGYMSNRGRQLVASCLVHELNLDWRFGAAYFEQQLIDYDVAANWGNWQYLAGVGADPRAGRHFNLAKQTQMYDPHNTFINHWRGNNVQSLDSSDAADWPLSS